MLVGTSYCTSLPPGSASSIFTLTKFLLPQTREVYVSSSLRASPVLRPITNIPCIIPRKHLRARLLSCIILSSQSHPDYFPCQPARAPSLSLALRTKSRAAEEAQSSRRATVASHTAAPDRMRRERECATCGCAADGSGSGPSPGQRPTALRARGVLRASRPPLSDRRSRLTAPHQARCAHRAWVGAVARDRDHGRGLTAMICAAPAGRAARPTYRKPAGPPPSWHRRAGDLLPPPPRA